MKNSRIKICSYILVPSVSILEHEGGYYIVCVCIITRLTPRVRSLRYERRPTHIQFFAFDYDEGVRTSTAPMATILQDADHDTQHDNCHVTVALPCCQGQ